MDDCKAAAQLLRRNFYLEIKSNYAINPTVPRGCSIYNPTGTGWTAGIMFWKAPSTDYDPDCSGAFVCVCNVAPADRQLQTSATHEVMETKTTLEIKASLGFLIVIGGEMKLTMFSYRGLPTFASGLFPTSALAAATEATYQYYDYHQQIRTKNKCTEQRGNTIGGVEYNVQLTGKIYITIIAWQFDIINGHIVRCHRSLNAASS